MDQDRRTSQTESSDKKTGRANDSSRADRGAVHSDRQVSAPNEPRVKGRYSPAGDVLPSEDDRHNGP